MSALRKTPFVGTVTWLGVVNDSRINLRAEPTDSFDLTLAGQEGECHAGLTRASCARVMDLYPKGTTIRNTRQLSILSAEEICQMASNLHLPSSTLDPHSMGASMVLEGLPDLSHLPPNSRLQLQNQDGTTLTIDLVNAPCMFTGQVVHADYDIGHWNRFKPAAAGLRGVTAWVERPGRVQVGDRVELFVPSQRPWGPLSAFLDGEAEGSWSGGGQGLGLGDAVAVARRRLAGMTALTLQLVYMMMAGMLCAAVGLWRLYRE